MPSKKIILYSILVISIVGVIFFFLRHDTTVQVTKDIETSTEEKLAIDSDSDGLKDWEEELWKTDRNKPDSDGDGTPDGQEIKTGRNPLAKGPNDKLDTETVDSKINTETDEDITDTDKFSRELFTKIIAGKQSSTPPTEQDFINFLGETVKKEMEDQKLKLYKESDIFVNADEDTAKIKEYGNEIAKILTKKPSQPLEYEMEIFDRAQQNADPSELKKLTPLIAEYKRIESDLLSLKVPKSATTRHLNLLNSTVQMAWSITGLQYIFSDPIKALPGVSAYAENAKNFLLAVRDYKDYLNSSGVVFVEGDSGYRFFDDV